MVDLSIAAGDSIRSGLLHTTRAIGEYAGACRGLRRMPGAGAIAESLDLTIARLDAMQGDLDERVRRAANADALFVALQVAEAGLSSLTDSVGEMRSSYSALLPHEVPLPGWFDEEASQVVPGAEAEAKTGRKSFPADASQ